MHYDLRKIFCTTALALVLGMSTAARGYAQGVVMLNDSAANDTNTDEIPDEISLFGDDSPEILSPAKPASKTAALKTDNQEADNQKADSEDKFEASATKTTVKRSPSPLSLDSDETPQASVQNIPAPRPNVPEPAAAPISIPAPVSSLDSHIVEDIDDSVFNQMSNLEKETAILNLELRKEQVKSNIEALKSVQEKARQEENAKKEAERRKTIEWEKEQEKKVLIEQQKLKNLELLYEKARQEKLLKAYKNKMLEERQAFIKDKADIYNEIAELRNDRQKLINNFKGRFIQLTKMADQATNDVIRVRDNYAKTISDLQTQISILRARLEASENANPFAENGGEGAGGENAAQKEHVSKLSDLYAIMEVRGKGESLAAKLINDSGIPFMVKVGTVLQTGHIIDEINTTHIRADKEGNKEYLYFSAGGILDKEPEHNEELKIKVSEQDEGGSSSSGGGGIVSSQGIPGVASEMTIR